MLTRNFFLILFILQCNDLIQANGPFPIQFSIPESKIVSVIPKKQRDFAFLIPAQTHTYIYDDELSYQKGYQESFFAITTQKAGWDCMRHYEILANGCIPYFINLENCHPRTMAFLPRKLILEAMNLPGVPKIKVYDPRNINPASLKIDHGIFDIKRYYEILNELLRYTRTYLTTRSIAQYVLKTVNYAGGTVLFLSGYLGADYQRECSLIGLKQVLGEKLIDVPRIDCLYTDYPGDVRNLWGKGFSYAKIIDDVPVNRENIDQRIRNKEFELIIYGSVHRGLPFHDVVQEHYEPNSIIYICGEDGHKCSYSHWNNLFLREFDSLI